MGPLDLTGMFGGSGGYSFGDIGGSSAEAGDQTGGAFYGAGINKMPANGGGNNQVVLIGLALLAAWLLLKK